MKVLIACEESQTVCIEFRKLGHEAYSCDLMPCSGGRPEWHIQYDAVRTLTKNEFITRNDYFYKETHYIDKWDLVIAFPPCTRLANSGVRWLNEKEYWPELDEAIFFFNQFVKYGEQGNKICIENPIQHKYARAEIRKYDQIIQPYQFGHMEQKTTCLWLFGVPALIHTNNVFNEMMELPYSERAKVHYCSPGENRSKLRSKTFEGIAKAMANQWSNLI